MQGATHDNLFVQFYFPLIDYISKPENLQKMKTSAGAQIVGETKHFDKKKKHLVSRKFVVSYKSVTRNMPHKIHICLQQGESGWEMCVFDRNHDPIHSKTKTFDVQSVPTGFLLPYFEAWLNVHNAKIIAPFQQRYNAELQLMGLIN